MLLDLNFSSYICFQFSLFIFFCNCCMHDLQQCWSFYRAKIKLLSYLILFKLILKTVAWICVFLTCSMAAIKASDMLKWAFSCWKRGHTITDKWQIPFYCTGTTARNCSPLHSVVHSSVLKSDKAAQLITPRAGLLSLPSAPLTDSALNGSLLHDVCPSHQIVS